LPGFLKQLCYTWNLYLSITLLEVTVIGFCFGRQAIVISDTVLQYTANIRVELCSCE